MRHSFTKVTAAVMTAIMCITTPVSSPLPNGAFAPVTVYAAGTYTDAQRTAANVSKVQAYSSQLRNANSSGKTTGMFTWDTESKNRSWTYYNGLMMDAFAMEGSSNYTYVDNFYNANIGSDGTIANFSTGQLDSVEPIRGAFDLFMNSGYTSSGATKYKNGIQKVYTMLEDQVSYSGAGGNFAHKQDSNGSISTTSWATYPIALDGIYMAQPFLMECARAIAAGKLTLKNKNGSTVGADSIYTGVYNRMVWIYNNLYNTSTHLFDHASNPSGGTNRMSWSRAIGWYAMALVDVIEMMPNDYRKTNLIAELPRLFDGLMEYQDASTGMWYNVTAYGSSLSGTYQNKLETSGTVQFAYAMMKAYNNGYVSSSKYAEAGLRAFNGTIENKMTGSSGSYHVTDTYRSSGASTVASDYLKNPYVTDEAKGVGALIMAATLANTTSQKYETATAPQFIGITVTPPTKTTYLSGENLNTSGMVATALYSNGSSQNVTGYTVSALPKTAGTHTITVTYQGKTASFTVTVHKESGNWIVTVQPTCQNGGRQEMYCEGCGQLMRFETIQPTGHVAVAFGGTEPTCTVSGYTSGTRCQTCGEVLTEASTLQPLGHQIVTDKGYPATCTRTGLTDGSHCSVCGEVLSVQEVIPAKGHNLVIEEGVPATCTGYGLTDEIYCSVCNITIQEMELIDKLGHDIVVSPMIPATCTEPGLTAGTSCRRCGMVVQKQYPISATDHVAKITEGYPATCEKDGCTDSSVCYNCGITLSEGEVIPALGHDAVMDEGRDPLGCTGTGLTEGAHCDRCHMILEYQQTIPAVGHNRVIDPAINATCYEDGLTAGVHCDVCGEILQPQHVINAIHHVEKIDPEVPATCMKEGHTERITCYLCDEVLKESEIIPATDHLIIPIPEVPATCTSSGLTEGSQCAYCLRIFTKQRTIKKKAHTIVVVPGQPAGLFTEGYTASSYCSECGTVITPAYPIKPIVGSKKK